MIDKMLMFFEENSTGSQWFIYVILGLLVVGMLVMSIVQRNKQKKQMEQLTNNLVVGSIVTTIGGIVGELIEIDETNGCYYIETGLGDKKHILQIVKNAIYSVRNKTEEQEVEEVSNEIK